MGNEKYTLIGSNPTAGQLVSMLKSVPKDYQISILGMTDFSIAKDDNSKTVLFDETAFIKDLL